MYILVCIVICALLIKTSLGDLLMVAALWGSVFLVMIGALSVLVIGALSLIKIIPIEIYTYGIYQAVALFICIKIYNTIKYKSKYNFENNQIDAVAEAQLAASDFSPPALPQ